MAPLPPADALTIAAHKLQRTGARWMLTGSVAALLYGRERSTMDIDIVVDVRGIQPGAFAAIFAPEYFLDSEMVRESMASGIMFNAIPLQGGPKIDLIPLAPDNPFDAWAFANRRSFDGMAQPFGRFRQLRS